MDFGLGRFVEVFEERFGRHPTTVLVALIGLGITALMIGLIWDNLADPLVTVIGDQDLSSGELGQNLARGLLSVAISLLLWFLLYGFVLHPRLYGAIRRSQGLMERINAAWAEVELLHKEVVSGTEESVGVVGRAEALLEDARSTAEDAESTVRDSQETLRRAQETTRDSDETLRRAQEITQILSEYVRELAAAGHEIPPRLKVDCHRVLPTHGRTSIGL